MGLASIFQRRKEKVAAAVRQRAEKEQESKRITEAGQQRASAEFHIEEQKRRAINEMMYRPESSFEEPPTLEEIMMSDLTLEVEEVRIVEGGMLAFAPSLVAKEGDQVVWRHVYPREQKPYLETLVQEHNNWRNRK